MRKTTEKIGTLHVNPDRIRQGINEEVPEETASVVTLPQEEKEEE